MIFPLKIFMIFAKNITKVGAGPKIKRTLDEWLIICNQVID